MIEQGKYPFEKDKYGISFEEQKVGSETFLLPSGSGKLLECRLSPHEISIIDRDLKTGLIAEVNDRGRMNAVIKTKLEDGTRHPDMFAGKFLAFSLEYFERFGIDVNIFLADWQHGSDEHKRFWENYRQYKNGVLAAKHTWTGETLGKLGFTELTRDDMWTAGDSVYAEFKKGTPVNQNSS